MEEQQKAVIRWFSAIELPVQGRFAGKISQFLATFKGVKTGDTNCHICPCAKRQYARGICGEHYNFFRTLGKRAGISWREMYKVGLVKQSANELRAEMKEELCNAECNPNDPLHVLIRKN